MSDEDIVNGAHKYAQYNGLEYPEVSILKSAPGRCVRIRAFKEISGIKMTYENRLCYGHTSMVILYVGAPSKTFPPAPAIPFFKSLKRLQE